jgi:hypothetical protein
MKIWNSYGSEHSANLVMIGKFKDAASAEDAKAAIDEITELMYACTDEQREDTERYPDGMYELLKKVGFRSVAPAELQQFCFEVRSEWKDTQVVITTDEPDISAFLKLMIDKGARVEAYSGAIYPDANEKSAS